MMIRPFMQIRLAIALMKYVPIILNLHTFQTRAHLAHTCHCVWKPL